MAVSSRYRLEEREDEEGSSRLKHDLGIKAGWNGLLRLISSNYSLRI